MWFPLTPGRHRGYWGSGCHTAVTAWTGSTSKLPSELTRADCSRYNAVFCTPGHFEDVSLLLLVLLFFLLLFFFLPISIYCVALASINRRLRPVIVSGSWDCVGLLFAASGFFLVVIPGILMVLYARNVRNLPLTAPGDVSALWRVVAEWWAVWGLYYLTLVLGAVLAVWYQGRTTVIYNIDPQSWEQVFAAVLNRLGLEQMRCGKKIMLGAAHQHEEEALVAPGCFRPPSTAAHISSEPLAVLRADVMPNLCNVSLRWDDAAELRQAVEAELTRSLRQLTTADNPAAGWLMGIGGSLLSVIVFVMVLVLVLELRGW